jgi:Macrocin-O-methyltransferase (TylF)
MTQTEFVFRTSSEQRAAERTAAAFEGNPDSLAIKLDNFPKYVRRVPLKRFLAMYEIFKRILPVKGSIVECGVFRGFGTMSWAKLSAILEPENLNRRIYGFDTFAGFPSMSALDASVNPASPNQVGDLHANSHDELVELIKSHDQDRYLGHIPKVELIKGDICQTIAPFIAGHPHLLVSMLFLDCDLYEPTLAALRAFVPRMPAGALIVFDELDNPKWPGETMAMLECAAGRPLRLQRLEWDPYISFAEVGA